MNETGHPPRTAALLAASAALLAGSCALGPATVASRVAERPLSYSEDERLDEIERLDGRIASEMERLGLSRSDAVTKISAETLEPTIPATGIDDDAGDDGADDAPSDPPSAGTVEIRSTGSRGPGRSWCDRVCDSTRAICEAADKICRISDSLPGHPTARDRCARAREDCSAAKGKGATCGCG